MHGVQALSLRVVFVWSFVRAQYRFGDRDRRVAGSEQEAGPQDKPAGFEAGEPVILVSVGACGAPADLLGQASVAARTISAAS